MRPQKRSMKRQRPWPCCSSPSSYKSMLVAATILLSCGIACPTITARPSYAATAVAATDIIGNTRINSNARQQQQQQQPHHQRLRRFLQTVNEPPVETDVTSPPAPADTTATTTSIIKEKVNLTFDIVDFSVPAATAVNVTLLLQKVDNALEDYLWNNLKEKLENDFVTVKAVSLTVERLVRRQRQVRLLRLLQDEPDELVTMQVSGAIQFEVAEDANVDLDTFRSSVSEVLDTLLDAENLNDALQQANVVAVNDSTASKDPQQQDNVVSNNEQPLDDDDDAPTLLSIIFGFTLTAIAAAGLCLYAYVFFRKRKKQQAKRRQIKESVIYDPRKVSPRRSVAPNNNLKGTTTQMTTTTTPAATAKANNVKANNANKEGDDDSSANSSYNGIGSDSDEGRKDADDFAKELQLAASMDQQVWENFEHRKISREDGRMIDLMVEQSNSRDEYVGKAMTSSAVVGSLTLYDAHSPTSHEGMSEGGDQNSDYAEPRLAKSFPYGDEQEQKKPQRKVMIPAEEGVEWTAEQSGLNSDHWDPYVARSDKNKDDRRKTSRSSSAAIAAIERDMQQFGHTPVEKEKDNESLLTSDIVSEVEQLSKFVKRYEKKKERRQQRERDRHSHPSSSALSTPEYDYDAMGLPGRSMDFGDASPIVARDMSHLHNLSQDEKKEADSNTNDAYSYSNNNDNFSVSDGGSDDDLITLEDMSQRLGITPFSVQQPGSISYDDIAAQVPSPMMAKLARDSALRPQAQDDDTHPTDELTRRGHATGNDIIHAPRNRRDPTTSLSSLRGSDAVIGKGSGLKALRSNNAIVDETDSDVNLSLLSRAPSDEQDTRRAASRIQTPRQEVRRSRSRSSSFNNIVSMFETKEKTAIVPPDPNWQCGGSLKNK
jgi:hypothetical protein